MLASARTSLRVRPEDEPTDSRAARDEHPSGRDLTRVGATATGPCGAAATGTEEARPALLRLGHGGHCAACDAATTSPSRGLALRPVTVLEADLVGPCLSA